MSAGPWWGPKGSRALLVMGLVVTGAAQGQTIRLKAEPKRPIPDQFVVEYSFKPQAFPRLFVNDIPVNRYVGSPEEDQEPETQRGFPIQHFVVPGKNTLRLEVKGHAKTVHGKLEKLSATVAKDLVLSETYTDVAALKAGVPLTFEAPADLRLPLWKTGQKIVWSEAEKAQVHAKIVELRNLLQEKKFQELAAWLADSFQETVRLTEIGDAQMLAQREMMDWSSLAEASDWSVRAPSMKALDCKVHGGGWLVECLEKGKNATLQVTSNETTEGRSFLWRKTSTGYVLYDWFSLF